MIDTCEEFIGKTYNIVMVLAVFKGYRKNGIKVPKKFLCKCLLCGKESLRSSRHVIVGIRRSCECIGKLKTAENNRAKAKHGQATRQGHTPEYRSWYHMIQRCRNPKNKNFHTYGGRNPPILVCDEWIISFKAFFEHIGPKPNPKRSYSLDRINNNGNYEPGNVRWATQKEQVQNSSVIRPKIIKNCLSCKKEIIVTASQEKRKYCSRKCLGMAMSATLKENYAKGSTRAGYGR